MGENKMRNRSLIAVAGAALAIFVLAYAVSPVLAARSLAAAAKDGDADQLQQLVDFPAVRESLKGQLTARVMASVQGSSDMQNNPFAGFAMAAAPMIVGQMIDGFVTPDGISAIMTGRRPKGAATTDTQFFPVAGKAPGEMRFSYKNLDTFILTRTDGADEKNTVRFFLHRRGLFTWRLTRIQIPEQALGQMQGANTPAVAAAAPSPTSQEDDAGPAVQALLAKYAAENETCRGSSDTDPAMAPACDAREKAADALRKAGWCYGENAAAGYQEEWRPCGHPRFASTEEAERAADADAAEHGAQ